MDHLDVPVSQPAQTTATPAQDRGRSRYAAHRGRRWSQSETSSHSVHDGEIHDHFHTERPQEHYGPKFRRWHHRPQSPGVRWYKKYTERSLKNGRVLVIDYVRHDLSKEGTRKVSSQEITSIAGLRHLYASQRRDEAVLRVYHVQNADWAVQFLFKKFNIVERDDLVDSDFGRWLSYKHPAQARGGRPLLGGMAWQTQHDPWRGISKTSFGLDYLKIYKVVNPGQQAETDPTGKMMELNCYDEVTESPEYGYDVYGQRMSVYIQRKENFAQSLPNVEGIDNPYEDTDGSKQRSKEYFPLLETLDNGNSIIIFENSKSGSIDDTLIKARGNWESRWRRLPFYLAFDSQLSNDDDDAAVLCARTIVSDIWRAVAENWAMFLAKAGRHTEILEAKIYERPADESRADEIWRDSSMWLKCERLAYLHQNLIEEVGNHLRELDDSTSDESWLQANVADFRRINNLVQEDLVKPTTALSDLMYKSVGIRDTRHSLELSYSMWRLSWITFIFLPLTFTVGFFGMNVNTFASDPDIRWFFAAAVPMMVLVLASWFILKWALTASQRDPYSRSVYERLYHDLAVNYPALWTRMGPMAGQLKISGWQRLKWALIVYWNDPEQTIRARNQTTYNEDDRFDGLGSYSRMKRILTRRWTVELNKAVTKHREIEEGGPATGHPVKEGLEVVQQTLNLSVPGAAANGNILHLPNGVGTSRYSVPGYAKDDAVAALAAAAAAAAAADYQEQSVPSDLDHRVTNLHPIGSPPSSDRRSSAGAASRNSGVMVEEHAPEISDDDPRREESNAERWGCHPEDGWMKRA